MNSLEFNEKVLHLIKRLTNESTEFDGIVEMSPEKALETVNNVLDNINVVLTELEEIKYVLLDAEDELESSVQDLKYSNKAKIRAIEKIKEQF